MVQASETTRLNDAQIRKVCTPFWQNPCAATAQAVMETPGIPERFRKQAEAYTPAAQAQRAEASRAAAMRALAEFNRNYGFTLPREQEMQLREAANTLMALAKVEPYKGAIEANTAKHMQDFYGASVRTGD